MRAAIYARVSTGRQERDQTIDGQLTALRPWATCGPTTHRFVWKEFLPPPHQSPECLREPTAAARLGVGYLFSSL